MAQTARELLTLTFSDLRAGSMTNEELAAFTAETLEDAGFLISPRSSKAASKNKLSIEAKLELMTIIDRAAREGHGGNPDPSLLKLARAFHASVEDQKDWETI